MSFKPVHICHQCKLGLRKDIRSYTTSLHIRNLSKSISITKNNTSRETKSKRFFTSYSRKQLASKNIQNPQFWSNDVTLSTANHTALVDKAQSIGSSILNSQTIPSEEEVLKALELLKYASLQLNNSIFNKSPSAVDDLLGAVSTNESSHNQAQRRTALVSTATNVLSTLAYQILKHPPVFINEKILKSYLDVQLALQKPDSFPEIFDLYVHKPVPIPESSPIRYKQPSPKSPSQAVPKDLIDQTLKYAIQQKKLMLALDIIDSTYATQAYQRNRFIRKAGPGILGLALTPIAAIPLAHGWASMSNVADPASLAFMAWAGMVTYVGTVSSLGYIALTTYNDQMQRVTWLPGTPLSSRWLREDERAAVDQVALAWGFQDVYKRGEEEGPEWELLKEWSGRRCMIVDATELMEGME